VSVFFPQEGWYQPSSISICQGEDVQEGSSIRLMAPLMHADERWTMNE